MDALCPVPAFNDYLRSFRDAYKAANKADATGLAGFFTQLVAEKISLITKLEVVTTNRHLFSCATSALV